MNTTNGFRLTYSTIFDPPAELHRRFEQSLARIKSVPGRISTPEEIEFLKLPGSGF